MITVFITAAVCGYLIGSIPFGLVITRLAGLGDIRKIGSGNIGATNVLRTGRKDLALLTLLCDIGKAALIALVFQFLFQDKAVGLASGVAAVIGHNYPIWLKFKGGKGVASTLGLMLAMTPLVGVITALVWLFMAFTFRYSSLSALTAFTVAPVVSYFIEPDKAVAIIYLLLTALSFYRHRSNIVRLIHGKESKIKLKKKE